MRLPFSTILALLHLLALTAADPGIVINVENEACYDIDVNPVVNRLKCIAADKSYIDNPIVETLECLPDKLFILAGQERKGGNDVLLGGCGDDRRRRLQGRGEDIRFRNDAANTIKFALDKFEDGVTEDFCVEVPKCSSNGKESALLVVLESIPNDSAVWEDAVKKALAPFVACSKAGNFIHVAGDINSCKCKGKGELSGGSELVFDASDPTCIDQYVVVLINPVVGKWQL
jgi:hypothetical protein